MSSTTPTRHVLGVFLTPQTIEALLVVPAADDDQRPRLVRRFVRPRLQVGEPSTVSDFETSVPGLKSSEETDFTLQVGSASVDDDLAFDPTLQDLQSSGAAGDGASPSTGSGPRLFISPLRDILEECEAVGAKAPEVVFCAGAPDIAHVEVTEPPDKPAGTRNGLQAWWNALPLLSESSERRALVAALRREYKGGFNAGRVAFLPMTPDSTGAARHLGLVPTGRESVTPTLNALFNRDDVSTDATARRLDSELSLYVSVVRRYLHPKADHSTVVVRVSSADTLVLFLHGNELLHVEQLRSLTSYDAPDTIASRILLYQDEQKIDRMHGVLLVGGPRDERLVESFRSAYPDAAIGRLHDLLTTEWVEAEKSVQATITPESGPALAAALYALDPEAPPAEALNLLGKTDRTQKRTMPVFAWHTVAMLVLLAGATLFFAWRYVDQTAEIQRLEARVNANPIAMPELSPQQLRQRVDSLNAVHADNERSLYVLDSLLAGSTEWSETIERTARQTGSIDGIWFEEWSITPTEIILNGMTLNRGRRAGLARNLKGTVQSMTYSDIDDRRVYAFEIQIPRVTKMPEAATKLRARSMDAESARTITTPAAAGPAQE